MPGKFNHAQLSRDILPYTGSVRPEVICGPSFGIDVSVISLGYGQAMAMTSDPLSFLPSLGLQESAWLSVHLMANDMGTTGHPPMYSQMVLNLNDHLSQEDINEYWSYVHEYCKRIGVSITGGHTGTVYNQQTTISGGGTMSLVAPVDKILTANLAKPGDAVIVTGVCAMSSAAILALSFPEFVKNEIGHRTWQEACDLFWKTSSLDAALIASGYATGETLLNAMHDVTEGGVMGAIYEMAAASGLGVSVIDEHLPISEVTSAVCNAFELDPAFVIGAGAIILSCPPQNCDRLIKKLNDASIPACVAGHFSEQGKDHEWIKKGQRYALPYHQIDPYWQAFADAFQKQLK